MTIETNFLGLEDPEKIVASIQMRPAGVKELIKAVMQKFARKGNWESINDRPMTPNRFINEREY